jgi:hypothetical protein
VASPVRLRPRLRGSGATSTAVAISGRAMLRPSSRTSWGRTHSARLSRALCRLTGHCRRSKSYLGRRRLQRRYRAARRSGHPQERPGAERTQPDSAVPRCRQYCPGGWLSSTRFGYGVPKLRPSLKLESVRYEGEARATPIIGSLSQWWARLLTQGGRVACYGPHGRGAMTCDVRVSL